MINKIFNEYIIKRIIIKFNQSINSEIGFNLKREKKKKKKRMHLESPIFSNIFQ